MSDRNDQAAVEVDQLIKDDWGKSVAVSCDVTNDQALGNLIKTMLNTFGKITLLVNNAGGAVRNFFPCLWTRLCQSTS